MNVTFLSHTAMGGSFVVGSHHLSQALVRAGHRVTHVSAPVTPFHLAGASKSGFVRTRLLRWWRGGAVIHGVLDIVPMGLLPWSMMRQSAAGRRWYSTFAIPTPVPSARGLELQQADALVVDEPRFVGLARRRPGQVLIYRATDLYAAMRGDDSIAEAERRICLEADQIIATSEPVAEHLRRLSGKAVAVITNGVDFERFSVAQPEFLDDGSPLPGQRSGRAVYIGAFDQRFGASAVAGAAQAMPSHQFVLAGPGSEAAAASIALRNVIGLGAIPYERVPSLLQACTVGLLPLSADRSNQGRSPMKLYEYAAAGLAIAATSTEELRRRALRTMCLADDGTSFPDAVANAFRCAQDPGLVSDARLVANGESWTQKAHELMACMVRPAPHRVW